MLANTLQEELLSIPGIAGAEIEGERDHPHGVRVQLAAGADADLVGLEVQRVLAAHGMRSQLSREDEPLLPPGSVVNLADYEDEARTDDAEDVAPDETAVPGEDVGTSPGPPVIEAAAEDETSGDIDESTEAALEVMEGPPPEITIPSVEVDVPDEGIEAAAVTGPLEVAEIDEFEGGTHATGGRRYEVATGDAIAGVAVEERMDRVAVTVRTASGALVTQMGPATPDGISTAAALAAAAAASPDAAPRIVSISSADVDGSHVVSVVFEVGTGERRAGAAVIRGSRASAVARAAWAALRG